MRGILPILRDAWHLARPYFSSEEKWSARLLLTTIIILNLGLVALDVVLSYWNKEFFNALEDKNWDSFIALLFFYRIDENGFIPGFTGVAIVYIAVAVYRQYLNQWLQIRWRRWMTTQFLDGYFADRAFYRIALLGAAANGNGSAEGTDNPDQRIADDVRGFVAETLTLSLDLLSNVVTLFSFVFILWTLSGPVTLLGITIPGYMVFAALLYAAVGSILTHLVGRPLAALNFRQQRVEADFRFSLARLRENAEGIALQGGEAQEKLALSSRFAALADNWWAIMQRTKLLNAFVAGYGQIAGVFPIVVAAPRYFAGQLPLGGLTQTAGAFGQVQSAMSWFVTSYASLAAWQATVGRLATFQRAIAAARAGAQQGLLHAPGNGSYVLDNVTLDLPDGRPLLQDTTFTLPPGHSVVVTGRSGSGKSTLFRALAGIWPFGRGQIRRPAGRALFLPQRPYLPLGTLRRALTYPDAIDAFPDPAIREALDTAGLGHLAPRLDSEETWSQLLSGGELQRLALARALLVRPEWLFLDEATASLDPASEAEFYATIQRELPRTTVISIAHRPAVADFHDQRLLFDRPSLGPGRLVAAADGTA